MPGQDSTEHDPVAASGSAAEALQERFVARTSCSVQECYRSVLLLQQHQLQRPRECCRSVLLLRHHQLQRLGALQDRSVAPQIGLKGPIGTKMGFIARNLYEMASLEGFGAPGGPAEMRIVPGHHL